MRRIDHSSMDGDEINVHAFQLITAVAEIMGFASAKSCIMNAQTNRPIMGAVYDTLTGAHKMTLPETNMPLDEFWDALMVITSTDQLPTLSARLEKYKINPTSGRALFSAVLPADFYYEYGGVYIKDGVLISGTILKKHIGTTDNSIVQVLWKDYGVARTVDFLTDLPFVVNYFLSNNPVSVGLRDCLPNDPRIQKIVKEEITKARLAVESLGAPPKDPLERERHEKQVVMAIEGTRAIGSRIMGEVLAPRPVVEVLNPDLSVNEETLRGVFSKFGVIDNVTKEVDPESRDRTFRIQYKKMADAQKAIAETVGLVLPGTTQSLNLRLHDKVDNTFYLMVEAGTKGSEQNVMQMMGAVGQQYYKRQRLKPHLSQGTRCSPHFDENERTIESRGFCMRSFMQGLSPAEFFFHHAGGREGLMDTALKTADTGSMHHKIVRALEDIRVAYDGSVRNPVGTIFQFVYGDDGFDASELQAVYTRTGKMTSFIDFKASAGRINARYGF